MQSNNDSSSSLLDEQNAPQPPRDPSALRTESENRRNQPVKPMRRRARRRQTDDDTLDWDNLPSVPIVRREATPESGEDYWIDLSAAQKSAGVSTGRDDVAAFDLYSNSDDDGGDDGSTTVVSGRGGEIDDSLRDRLKQEVVSPYTQNWILRVTVGIVVLIVLVAIFGGSDKAPIIPVPDL